MRWVDVVLRVRGDFNGLSGGVLCLSHTDSIVTDAGTVVSLQEGMLVTAVEDDVNEAGMPDHLIASGVVEKAPVELAHRGSRWVLRIDGLGVRHEAGE